MPRLTPEAKHLLEQEELLEKLAEQLTADEMEFAETGTAFARFRAEYFVRVAPLYAELHRLEADVAIRVAQDERTEDARTKAAKKEAGPAHSRRASEDQSDETMPAAEREVRAAPSPDLKQLYREAAKRVHPDLATEVPEKERRHRIMTALNTAYALGDAVAIQRMIDIEISRPEAIIGDDWGARLMRVIRKVAQVRARLSELAELTLSLRADPLFVVFEAYRTGWEAGQDPLAADEASIRKRIATARALLAALEMSAVNAAERDKQKLPGVVASRPYVVGPGDPTISFAVHRAGDRPPRNARRRVASDASSNSTIIGIDLGTTNSVVAVMEGGEPTVIPSAEGGRTVPSVVAFTKGGERLVGQLAKRQAVTNPTNTVSSIKRFMGRRFDDPETAHSKELVPYKVERDAHSDGVKVVLADGKTYTPPEISAMILQKLKADAEAYLGEKVTEAVITVPAYFDDTQRQATKDAGRIAGLDVKRIINEPTASALAYGLDKNVGEKIAVYALGKGTFDISILELGEGVFEVKATNGDTHLGGDDFDQRVIEWLLAEFKRDEGIDLRADPQALQRLKEAAEKAKIELSTSTATLINVPYITAHALGPKHLLITLTRADLEDLCRDLIDKTRSSVSQALKDAGLRPSDIDEVVLVGGQTRMLAVIEAVKQTFGGKEPHRGVNPVEVVAIGAAIQAGVLAGEVKDVLLGVTPLSIGIETVGPLIVRVIGRRTPIPTSKSLIFTTAVDNQNQMEIHVLQGERDFAADNKTLGKFVLDGIQPAPRGVPQIEVTFDIDASGILDVTAKDRATGRQQRVRITGSSLLSKKDVDRMVGEAAAHADEDRTRKEEVERRR